MDPEDLIHINDLLDHDADLREVLFHAVLGKDIDSGRHFIPSPNTENQGPCYRL